jgi:hypothetical protein
MNSANVFGNNLRNDVTGLINKYSKKSTTTQSGGDNTKTQKNKSNKIRMFIDNNLPKITKFILYINKYLHNINTDNTSLYNLANIASKIFIPFQKLMNKINQNIYESSKYTRFMDFYNNQILHPCNIMNQIYDVCKLMITDVYFIDKLYNKLSHINNSDLFKEIKNMTIGSYTQKYNNNKIDLLIK